MRGVSFVRVCIGIVDRILLKRTLAADTAATHGLDYKRATFAKDI